MFQDTLYVDGVNLKSLPGIVVNDIEYFAPGTKRGNNETIPGRRGQVGVAKPLDAYGFSVMITVLPVTGSTPEGRRSAMINQLRALSHQLHGFKSGGQVKLQRRLTTGVGQYETTEANGEYVKGTDINLINFTTGKTELEFVNLDGCWYQPNYEFLELGSSGSYSIKGDFATRRIALEFDSPGTLNNATANASLTITDPATVFVTDYKVTAGLQTLRHEGDIGWFVVVPGNNNITWSGAGQPRLFYKPAFI